MVIAVQLPDSSSLERTDEVVDRISKIASETPGIKATIDLAGLSADQPERQPQRRDRLRHPRRFRDAHAGSDQRRHRGEIAPAAGGNQGGICVVFSPPPVNGMGVVGGFKMELQDRGGAGLEALQGGRHQLMAAANRSRRCRGSITTFRASTPQLYLDVDRLKAKSMGVPLSDIFDTLQIYLGSLYVNDFNLFGRTYHVTAQADSAFRREPEDILNFKARNNRGEMVPLGSLVNVRDITGPDHIVRYDMYPAAEITGNATPGVSSGDAIATMEKPCAKNSRTA